jgi:hypothetical protein
MAPVGASMGAVMAASPMPAPPPASPRASTPVPPPPPPRPCSRSRRLVDDEMPSDPAARWRPSQGGVPAAMFSATSGGRPS